MPFFNSNSQPAFSPQLGQTVNLTAGVASANVQVGGVTEGQISHVRVFNSTGQTAFVTFGSSNAVAASTTVDLPIPAGGVEIFTTAHAWAACILGSGSGVVYFTPGDGL